MNKNFRMNNTFSVPTDNFSLRHKEMETWLFIKPANTLILIMPLPFGPVILEERDKDLSSLNYKMMPIYVCMIKMDNAHGLIRLMEKDILPMFWLCRMMETLFNMENTVVPYGKLNDSDKLCFVLV